MPGLVAPLVDEREVLLAFLGQQRDALRYAAHGLDRDQAAGPADGQRAQPGRPRQARGPRRAGLDDLPHDGRYDASSPPGGRGLGRRVPAERGGDPRRRARPGGRAGPLDREGRGCAGGPRRPAGADHRRHPVDPRRHRLDARWVLLHLIEETARHAGHADIIRESIDGATCWTLMAPPRAGRRRTGRRGRRTRDHRVDGACRSTCGPTTPAPGAPSAWPGSTVALTDFEHGDAVTVVHRAFELDRQAPARVDGLPGGASAPQVRHVPRAGPGRPRAADRARGGGGLHLRLRARASGQHVRCPPADPGGARDRAGGPLVQRLFAAHFSEGRQLSDHEVLRDIAPRRGAARRRHRGGARRRGRSATRSGPTRRPPRSST